MASKAVKLASKRAELASKVAKFASNGSQSRAKSTNWDNNAPPTGSKAKTRE
ncbi:hypothetical protein [Peribacillus sp. SI8-4]|uniref:hypothetical protein n=1 Tax=Peribacillus sp. SI8-4 TaxID=3048009 RepID=UPI002552EB76|nr:hypothetical protein [Peribacillus sp. SI8-4]